MLFRLNSNPLLRTYSESVVELNYVECNKSVYFAESPSLSSNLQYNAYIGVINVTRKSGIEIFETIYSVVDYRIHKIGKLFDIGREFASNILKPVNNKMEYMYDNIFRCNGLIFKKEEDRYVQIKSYIRGGFGLIGLKLFHHHTPVINNIFTMDYFHPDDLQFTLFNKKKTCDEIMDRYSPKHYIIFTSFSNIIRYSAHLSAETKKIFKILFYLKKKYKIPRCILEYILQFE